MTAHVLAVLFALGAPDTRDVHLGAREIAATCRHEARPHLCIRAVAVIWAHEAHFVRMPRERGGGRGPLQVAKVSPGYASIDPAVPLTGFRAGWVTFEAKLRRAHGDVRRAFELYSGRSTGRTFARWAVAQLRVTQGRGKVTAAGAAESR